MDVAAPYRSRDPIGSALMVRNAFRDFCDLAITTEAATAAHSYSQGIRLLISSSVDAEASLRVAVQSDPRFALAWMALAFAVDLRGRPGENLEYSDRASAMLPGATRRERQHIEVIRLVLSGERERAAVLGREHLREFPHDALVSYVVASRGLV